MDETKIIYLPNEKKTKRNTKKNTKPNTVQNEKKIRVVTKQSKWIKHITDNDINCNVQLELLELEDDKKVVVLRELKRKIDGYRYQDLEKHLFTLDEFVDLDFVIQLLQTSNGDCYYCKESIKILYDISRDPKQWTLERIDNKLGHNKGNVEICCLSCNIKRRTMYHEKFRFTKQMVISKEK
jgi:hypothetical protein